ncbi:MAG: hypothetical protein ACE5ES_05435, partial [Candidatus Nanoarchaeia archaeon]
MKNFVFLYPIDKIFDIEIENGAVSLDRISGEIGYGVLEKFPEQLKPRRKIIEKEVMRRKKLIFGPIYAVMLNGCINARYRKKGFGINYVIFDDSEVSDIIKLRKEDRVIRAGISEDAHYIDGEYPNEGYILNQLKLNGRSELVVGGFHVTDCVDKLAEKAYERGIDVLVDEDLTNYFESLIREKGFMPNSKPSFNSYRFITSRFRREVQKKRKTKPWLYKFDG